jgi:hypothetical protein
VVGCGAIKGILVKKERLLTKEFFKTEENVNASKV